MKYDFRARSDASRIFNTEPSLTKQSFKDACDINNILKKYVRNGVNPFVITQSAQFGDYTDLPTYQESLNLVTDAQESFDSLPASLRKRFDNDPGLLMDFLSHPENRAEAINLGLIEAVKNSPASPVTQATEGSSPTP
jgi:phage internal scaffolding protein